MSVLKILTKCKHNRELLIGKYLNLNVQSREVNLDRKEEITRVRRFLKPLSNLKLKQFNTNFVNAIFGKSFDKEILQYPEIFEEEDITTILNHSDVLEKFLRNKPKIRVDEHISSLGALELFGLSVAQKYGGAGYNRTEMNFLFECLGVEPYVGRFLGYNEDLGCRILNDYGNEEQKSKYLPRLAEGKSFITLAYLESDSLVDFSHFNGYAICDLHNKKYFLNANKKWVHNADVSDIILVLAKKTEVSEEDDLSIVKFNMFLTEKKNPGITVHKVLTKNSEDFALYDIVFKDVCVLEKNLLGNAETCGITVLKSALSHSFLTDSALCCSMIKQILQEVCSFIHESKIFEKLNKGYIMVQNNLSLLTMYTYVLESVIYLLSGRFDLHEQHDLFDESVLAKIIAVDMLKLAIQRYIEILGCQSFLASGILDEALKTLQYYSVMDENIDYLKMMIGANGLCYSTVPLSEKVGKIRNLTENFTYSLIELFKSPFASKNLKKKFRLEMELHHSLQNSANKMETSLCKFFQAIEMHFIQHGELALENEHVPAKFAEIAAYLYAITACLARSSSSVCYNFPKCELEVSLTNKFTHLTSHKIESIINEEIQFVHLNQLFREIGKITFNKKEYPAEHPLTRTY